MHDWCGKEPGKLYHCTHSAHHSALQNLRKIPVLKGRHFESMTNECDMMIKHESTWVLKSRKTCNLQEKVMGWAWGHKEKLNFSVKIKKNQDAWIKWKCHFSTWKQCFLINKLARITVQFLSWVVNWVVQYDFIVNQLNIISIVSPLSTNPCVLRTRKHSGRSFVMNFAGEGFLPIVATQPESLEKFLLFEQDYGHVSAEASSFARLFGRCLDLAFFSSDNINTSELFFSFLV